MSSGQCSIIIEEYENEEGSMEAKPFRLSKVSISSSTGSRQIELGRKARVPRNEGVLLYPTTFTLTKDNGFR